MYCTLEASYDTRLIAFFGGVMLKVCEVCTCLAGLKFYDRLFKLMISVYVILVHEYVGYDFYNMQSVSEII